MRLRLFALLILPTLALAVLAIVVVADRNSNYRTAQTASDTAAVATQVARVDRALGNEELLAADLLEPKPEDTEAAETAETEPHFAEAARLTDDELDRLQSLTDQRAYHPDLGDAIVTIRQTLQFRDDITNRRVTPLQINDRYGHIRDSLLDALSTQATEMDDAAGQQRVIALISLIKSRGSHLDERLVVELALSYGEWAPGQHTAAVASRALQEERIQTANAFFSGTDLVPPEDLALWRQEIGTKNAVPDLTVAEWRTISDGWLDTLNFYVDKDQQDLADSLEDSLDSAASQRLATTVGVSVVVAAMLAITAAVSYRLVTRVGIITEQARRMANGEPSARTFPKVGGADELGRLAEAFDEMISQVEQRTNQQQIQSAALEAIANHTPLGTALERISPLLGVDANGEALYRFAVDEHPDKAGITLHANTAEGPELPDLDSPAYGTAMGLAATARQRSIDRHRLQWQASHDDLTGLLNRGAIIRKIEILAGRSAAATDAAAADQPFALLYADLDGFKALNDKFGHGAGDLVLTAEADRLEEALAPRNAMVGRFGGDEFLIVVPAVTSLEALEDLAAEFAEIVAAPVHHPAAVFELGVTIGAALSRPGVGASQLLDEVDSALLEARRHGPGTTVLSTIELRQRISDAEQLRVEVAAAFEADQFEAWYQPVWGGDGSELVGLEALVRWRHPERGMVSPGDFLPIVSDLRLLPKLDGLIFEKVCLQTAEWFEAGYLLGQVHVNISTERLEAGDFVAEVRDVLQATSCPASVMVAEVTETGLMTDTGTSSRILQALRDEGLRIAVDDFGQGYSSLAYLSELPVDLLKIDRRFVDRIDHVEAHQAIAAAVIELGHGLGLTIVAEGIERGEELDHLLDAGSELFQGYLLGRPLPVKETTALLGRGRSPVADAQRHPEVAGPRRDNPGLSVDEEAR